MRSHFLVRCVRCGRTSPDDVYEPTCADCGGMNDAVYDLNQIHLECSENPYRRFRWLLPIRDDDLLPGDTTPTPLVHATEMGRAAGLERLYLKDETANQTGTTKDRMAAVALAYLFEHGIRSFTASSTGNSSTAFAHAIARFPGMVMHLFTAGDFLPRLDIPPDAAVCSTVLEDTTFVEACAAAAAFAAEHGLAAERGFFNPGRREGLKLAYLEATDQIEDTIDWYVQAVSSGMGVYGTARGAEQLLALGQIDRLPRLACVQQQTCSPMVRAWDDGRDHIVSDDIVENPDGIAKAILRGDPSAAYPNLLGRVTHSNGAFAAVTDDEIHRARRLVEDTEGISPCPAASAAVAGALKLRRQGVIAADDVVLVNLTGRERA